MTVRLRSLDEVREFSCLAGLQPFPVQLGDGARCADATSFMELFTLDLSKPLFVSVDAANARRFADCAEKFLV